ncbi:MAG: MerR family transcriptional regulator [Sulfitobacter sp.]|uniref:MerR family transcriptional regulator n=1 Tax=unclassified Sulfitobacter TaxID=196795 RepID=UPI002942940E|nr:MerR family transcriptional regulator [Sulfitobacter sp. LC.270.F.C4]WOI14254.1 MerR family transcriptional regulator [Sulfitobacter sp. LC.270.F.C4]
MVKSPDAFRTISEVADWLGIQAHVLRFWESKFTQVKPIKRAGGRRYYRPADMLLLGGIKKLLHDDGLTIKGVQKILREEGMTHVSSLSAPLDELDFAEPRPAPKPDIIRPETGVVLNFGGAKSDAVPEADVSDEDAEEAEPAADLDENALPVKEPASAAEATPVEEAPKAPEAAPVAVPRRSPVPPADDHPRATPDPLAPSDSATPDAPQLDEPAADAAVEPAPAMSVPSKPEPSEPEPASNASLPDFLKRPLAPGPEQATEAAPDPAPEPAEAAPQEDEVDHTPKPAIIDLPDFTPEADFPASPGLLSVGARVHRLPRDVQPRVAGLLLDLAELRARMAAEPGTETNY